MTSPSTCSTLAGRLAELLDPEARGADLDRLREHAGSCAPCAERLERHALLEADLASLGASVPAPPPGLRVPSPAEFRPAPVLRLRWAAAAAVMLAAGLVASLIADDHAVATGPGASGPSPRPVKIVSIEDAPSGIAIPDEELLRLSCGWDGVASLRPALDQ